MTLGILAVQGDFGLHQKILDRLGVKNITVRNEKELKQCDALIIPGGESTAFIRLLSSIQLDRAIKNFGHKRPIMGTCAGLIMLSSKVSSNSITPLNLIDIDVSRNAYGRQIDSFIDTVQLTLNKKTINFEGVFIRAPKINKIGEGVTPLGYHQGNIILAENDKILVATFHPELTSDTTIHQYFIEKVEKLL
jgi:5'-phosphate synthase pdxT subunit